MKGILTIVMKQNLLFSLLTTSIACLGLSSCGTGPSMSGSSLAAYHSYNRPATLPTNQSNVRVKVSTSHQMVYVMEGSKALLVMPVSSEPHRPLRPKGILLFPQGSKTSCQQPRLCIPRQQSSPMLPAQQALRLSFKGTPMPYWCEFKANYGFHTGWMKHRPCTPWLHPYA